MQFQAAHSDILQQKTACALLPIGEGKLNATAAALNKALDGQIERLIKNGDFKTNAGNTLMLYNPKGITAERILLVGLGKTPVKPTDFNKAMSRATDALKASGSKNAHWFMADVEVAERDNNWVAQQTAQTIADRSYRFEQLKSDKKPAPALKSVTLCVDKKQLNSAKTAVNQGAAVGDAMALARDLGNLPGNICTPTYLAKAAKKLASGNSDKLKVKVLNEKQMAELKMGSLLSVAAGSKEPAQLIVMEYQGAAKTQKPTVLVGKGITFDTGGISLKPGAGMDEMKFDMCGAASVIGAMQAIIQLQPKINVVCIVAAAENMPSGKATKPGDIVTSMAGKTIEILNTDAEGRLVLCDALTYAERFKPKAVVDVATLTGACVVALGAHASGLYSNRETLGEQLRAAGEISGDRAWPMPLWDEYKSQLDSNFADLANIGGPKAGSVTAACFLSHFAENYPWAHLDIAGTAWLSNAEKGATGRPVPLLVNFLLNHG